MGRRGNTRSVKMQLFLRCGRIDMYNMQVYAKEKLQLHHDPPFRETKHTVYDESYLLSEDVHKLLHKFECENQKEYDNMMLQIKENKKILEKKRDRDCR